MTLRIHRGYIPGCIGRISELHALFYQRLVGFGVHFEAKVARELAQFCEEQDERRDAIWLALDGQNVHGSIVIDGSPASTEGAHLRWFITSDEVRGRGIGSQLIESALAFCDAQKYPSVYLWTFEGLHSARHLYEKYGFRLVHQRTGAQWGNEVNEQRFERQRTPGASKA